MKKIVTFIIGVLFAMVPVCAFDGVSDIFFGGFYNYNNIFKGTTKYEKTIGSSTAIVNGDFNAVFKSGGMLFGFDYLINPLPWGIYFRSSVIFSSSMEQTIGEYTAKVNDIEQNFSLFFDAGGIYAFDFNRFSLNIAPAISFVYMNASNSDSLTHHNISNSLLGFGLTADLYAKYRYKYFVCTAGVAGSFYPFASVSASDSDINYGLRIRGAMSYNLRPYIAVGFTLGERTVKSKYSADIEQEQNKTPPIVDIKSKIVSIRFHTEGLGYISAHIEGDDAACTSPLKVEKNTVIIFTATPDFGYTIASWSIPANGKTAVLTATEDTDVYVTFKRDETPPKKTQVTGSSRTSISGRVIHTGPRGGQYYINKNGNKTYIRRRR